MPLPRELLEEMAAKRQVEHVEAERDKRRDYVRVALTCLFWSAVGTFCMLWSAHTTDMTYARIAFIGGQAIGYGGIAYTLLSAYRRGEQRGDW